MTGLNRPLALARQLAVVLTGWERQGDASLGTIGWAVNAADELLMDLVRLEDRARAHQLWSLPDHPFARTGGRCLHIRGCFYVSSPGHQPLTRSEAEAYLRKSHDRRRCQVCAPGIPEPPWVRVRSPGGQARWRLADDVELP